MYDSFIFRGEAVEDYAAEAFLGESYTAGGNVTRSVYALPMGGSALIGEDVPGERTLTMTLAPAEGREETPAWRRRILGWLQGARGVLVFRNDPETEWYCSFDKSGTAGGKISPVGGLTLTMTAQPLTRARLESVASGTTSKRALTLAMPAETDAPAPVRVVIAPKRTLTALTLTTPTGTVRLAGLTARQTIEYYAGDVHGEAARLTIGGAPNYSGLASGQWGRLTLASGEKLTVQTAGCEADVHLYARGWCYD